MDQRSGDGLFIGRIEISAISLWKGFSKLRDAGREDCFCSEEDHPEFTSSTRKSAARSRNPRKRNLEQWLRFARVNVVLEEDKENAINGKQKGQCSRGDM